MSIIARNINIPAFLKIENGCLPHIRRILELHHFHFEKPLIISESHILSLGGNDVVNAFNQPGIYLYRDNSIAEAKLIAREVHEKDNDVVISIGGGRVLDLGKYAATKAQMNYISIPTNPSNDSICSPVAVLKNDEGMTESLPVHMPIGILVDPRMLKSVPEEYIRAGIGDLFAKFSSIADWRLADTMGKDRIDDFAASMAYSAAELLFQTCRERIIDIHDDHFLTTLMHGLILSGIAMSIAGNSRPCSGAEHKISHAIDMLYPGISQHGLQVAVGTLFTTYLRNESIDTLLSCMRALKLPCVFEELGLSEDQAVKVLLNAPKTRERYTILEQLNLDEAQARTYIHNYEHSIAQR
ncbi:MAG: iron-containing alcohol dehydrogenase family protein [Candidatus Kerfeldbacteria bacterium]|nr:iron-containing alcohol dehydrogenase family protein [Candidatus Kerfeldbacteria bacterium]